MNEVGIVPGIKVRTQQHTRPPSRLPGRPTSPTVIPALSFLGLLLTYLLTTFHASAVLSAPQVDKGLVPMANTNGESWCMGLDGLDQRCAAYYKAGARFAKWRSVVSVASGPSNIALRDCAYGLARYAAIAQNAGLVPIVEPEVRDTITCSQFPSIIKD